MKRKATTADDTSVNIWDDAGKLALSIRFTSRAHHDAALDALQKMLDAAESVQKL